MTKDLETLTREKQYASEEQISFVNQKSGVRLDLRDDGCAVLQAGDCAIILDSANNQITFDSNIQYSNSSKNVTTTNLNNITINDYKLNPAWLKIYTPLVQAVLEIAKTYNTTDPATRMDIGTVFKTLSDKLVNEPLYKPLPPKEIREVKALGEILKNL